MATFSSHHVFALPKRPEDGIDIVGLAARKRKRHKLKARGQATSTTTIHSTGARSILFCFPFLSLLCFFATIHRCFHANMKKSADWAAWVLQLVFGFVVGGFLGFRMMSEGAVPPDGRGGAFVTGAALIGAALASRYGDRLWIGDSYRVIPPDEPQNNRASRTLSMLTGLAGFVFVLFALLAR